MSIIAAAPIFWELHTTKILNLILQGKVLALVSDAGTPLISDPGYKLVAFLRENNCQVLSVPGACSAIAALSVAGIASDRFMFVGFVPNTALAKENFFKDLLNIDSTLIFFETSNRLVASLEAMFKIFGNRTACVAREITKIYEQTKKDYLQNLIDYYQQNPPRGEIVILLSPPSKKGELLSKLTTRHGFTRRRFRWIAVKRIDQSGVETPRT